MIKYIFAFTMLLHGLIHFMGFTKAFGFAHITQLTKYISKTTGTLWLTAAVLFVAATALFLLRKGSWPLVAFTAAILSQLLIFSNWKDARFGSIANLIVLVAAIIGYGTVSYFNKYQKDVKKGLQQAAYFPISPLSETDIQHLPEQVKRYLRYTNSIGKPKVNNFRITFTGKLRSNEKSEWIAFSSEQYNFMAKPTRLFFMKATMKRLPVAGYHCFNNGDAFMDIRLLSLFRVQYKDGTEMDTAETVTFFNDMCCMAPATLIDKRINWLETDGNKVNASFTNNNITISAWLHFNDSGALINFISNDRYAADVGKKLPWATPLKDYEEMNGYKIARHAEAIYSYPQGDLCYGTFATTGVDYNCQELK
jgi:hypothetical protein